MRKISIISIFILAFCAFALGQKSNCPTISVTGPSSTQLGETATFTANVSGIETGKIEYQWSIDKRTIVEGQGTSTITVSTEELEDLTVTAVVEIKGFPEGCPNSDAETATMGCSPPLPIMFDESEISSQHLSSVRLDALISELENSPDNTAYFIIYPHKKDSSDELKNKENYIRNYLIANKIEPERLVFVTAGEEGYESEDSVLRIWRVPAGATPPTP